MQRSLRVAGVVLSILGMALPSRSARADFDLQAAFTSGVSWRREHPALKNELTSTAARDVPAGNVPIGGAITGLGAGFDSGMAVDHHVTIPVLGIAAYGAVGTYDTIVTSADGSIAKVHPWTTYEIDVLLPGLGLRMKQRRWMFGANVRTGVSYLHTSGTVAGANSETLMTLSGASFVVQVELEGCRRLDPTMRMCLQVAPRVYDFTFMNGATIGLRVEWGK